MMPNSSSMYFCDRRLPEAHRDSFVENLPEREIVIGHSVNADDR